MPASFCREKACLLLGALLLAPLPSSGEEIPATEETPLPILSAIDAPRDYLADGFVGMVSGIDRFFGDERNYQESNDSVLQFDITRVMGYGGEHRFVPSGRAKIHLPQTEKRLHLLIETNPDKSTNTDKGQSQAALPSTSKAPESYGAGLRYERLLNEHWHYSADGGIKFQGLSTTPYARTRLSYSLPLEQWHLKASETLFWFNTIGAGETTQLDLERFISEPLLFRATSTATWLHNEQNMGLRQDFSLFHTVDDRNALLYQASVVGVSRPSAHVTDNILLLLYRYRLHRSWMFFEISPQVHFPRERNFHSSGVLSLKLEILFDKAK